MSLEARFEALSREPLVAVGAPSRSIGATIRDIAKHREMLSLLVRRDLKSRYKDSALGFVWSLIKPLTQLFIYYVVMGKFLGAARGIPEFAIYVYTGLAAYSLFSEIISSSTSSIVGNSGLIKKIYIPREVFPLASVGSALFNFSIQLAVLLGATIVLGSPPLSPSILYFFPALLTLVIYGFALGLLFAALNVYLRDIQYLIEVVLMVLLWASPIVYSWTMVKTILGEGILLNIYAANPVTLSVLGFQRAFWMAGATAEYPPDMPMRFVITIVIGLIALFAAHRVFVRLQGNFAQEL